MASKYAKLLKDVPRLRPDDEKYQDRVDERKREITERTCAQLTARYRQLRLEKDRLEAKEKELNLTLEAVTQMLTDAFETEDITKLTLVDENHDEYTVSIYPTPYASLDKREDERKKFMEWVKKQELEGRLSLPWQTLNSIVKERLVAGQPMPPGVKLFNKPTAKLTDKGGKELTLDEMLNGGLE